MKDFIVHGNSVIHCASTGAVLRTGFALLALVFTFPAFAQTSLDGSGDTPTGYNTSTMRLNQSTNPPVDHTAPEEQYFDKALAHDGAAESPFVVQLVYFDTEVRARGFQEQLHQRRSDILVDKTVHIEPQKQGYLMTVAPFADKSSARQWCDDYKAKTREDCLVLNRTEEGKRLKRLADAIRTGMHSDAAGQEEIVQPERVMVHQFQRAWEKAESHAGVFETTYCGNCTYKMQVRELMVSNFELPRGEIISGFDIGDPTIFEAQERGDHRLAIIAKSFGADTNIQIYSKSGRVYPVYVRSLDVQSPLLPDLVFRVLDPTIHYTEVKKPQTLPEAAALIDAPKKIDTSMLLANLKPQGISDTDFLQEIPFDPGKLRFDGFKVWGSSDRKLQPSRVFRDDKHVYIQFDDTSRLPGFAAYSVFDGIDERIGTRVSGNTFIIKGIADMISLKSGNSYLCITLARDV